MTQIERLLDIMRRLRSEDGCPWDREQTLETLRPYAVEEVYEVIDAIDREDVEDHCEELGDLLLQVVFQAQLRDEAGEFSFDDVAKSISDKMVRRHPHVFGDTQVENSDEVLKNWNEIKEGEKAHKAAPRSLLDKVPHQLPALLKAQELQKKAAKVGFDWPSLAPVMDKFKEELGEWEDELEAGDLKRSAEEFGDMLFVLANIGRHLKLDSEQCLQDACAKFRRRFSGMEEILRDQQDEMQGKSLDELDSLWDEVKAKEV